MKTDRESSQAQIAVMVQLDAPLESEENVDEVLTDSFADELADIQAKTHDIEAMIDKYLSQK